MPSSIQNQNGEEKEIDLLEVIPVNEAVVNQWYGKIRSGKTYSATAQAIRDLEQGNVVYTSWKIDWNGYDERNSKWNLLWGRLGIKKQFKIFPKENWHYLPFDGVEETLEFYKPFTNFYDKFFSLTDCIVYLDEGQVPLNSYEKTKISQEKQNGILFTGHFNRSINIISQRPVQIHPILRANISRFYKIEKHESWLGGIKFIRSEYQETDANSLPDESKEPESVVEYAFDEKIAKKYNSKYMRGNTPASQKNFATVVRPTKPELLELRNKLKKAR